MTISIGFFGTPALAASVLSACLDAPDMLVRYAVTQPDKPVGRSGTPKPSPVKSLALAHDLPVYTPRRVRRNEELLEALQTIPVDYLVVVAYGLILPDEILALPRLLPVNVHGSILPEYRGAAPIQAAIAAGDVQT
jgi:methionyl-tRNA formyltransferase